MGIHDGHREKMRRRFLETGLEGFADHEALELLLYYADPPAGHQPHRPRSDGAVRLPLRRAERPGGGSGEGGGHRGERGYPGCPWSPGSAGRPA